MKPSRFVWLFWLGNAVLLAGVAVFMWVEGSAAQADREARNAAVADMATTEPRIPWQPDAERPPFRMIDTRLSPIERPKPPLPPVVPPPPPVRVEKTDDQLRDELDTALNKRFKLLRMMLSSSEEYPNIALVVADTARMQWFEGMDLKEEYATAKSAGLRKLAYDLKVLTIDSQGVLVDAASLEKPEKRFEILIEVSEDPLLFSAQFQPDGKALRPVEPAGRKDAEKPARPVPDPEREDEFSYDDSDEEVIEDFAKYTRSTDSGLEILPELPQESPARKYGAKGREIIKTINGEAVKSMSDVRRIVRSQYNAGTREFKVGFERDGVPDERTFKAPEKK